MAITSAPTHVDRVLRGGAQARAVFESGLTGVQVGTPTWKQGSFLCYDSTVPGIRAVTATTDAATILGIAPVGVTSGKVVGPYDGLTATDGAQAIQDFRGPIYDFDASMKLKSGDAFTYGCKVYLADGLDDQTVSITDPGDHNYVGIFLGAAVTPASAGTTGPVKIIARYPTLDV